MLLIRLARTARVALRFRAKARFLFRSASAVEAAQTRRLRRMVAHAYATIPDYRKTFGRLGLHPADLATAADLARSPLVERDQVQRDPVTIDVSFVDAIARTPGGKLRPIVSKCGPDLSRPPRQEPRDG